MILREMQADEAKGLQRLALKNFWRALEAPFVSKPKTAMVAEKDGKIIGGFLYSIENSGKNKLGFIDFFFVDFRHAGQGVGGALCKKGVAHMWAQGCDYLAAVVRDDNVGSWANFEKNGFTRIGLPEFTKIAGFGGLIKANIGHMYGFSPGCNLYFATRPENETLPRAKNFGLGQMFLHLIINIALVLIAVFLAIPMLVSGSVDFSAFFSELPKWILSSVVIFGGVMLSTYIGTLFSKRNWKYQLTTGGGMLSLAVSLIGGIFPLSGGFYPNRYENTIKFRRDMAITAILPWVFLMILLPLVPLLDFELFHVGMMGIIIRILLMFRCIPLFASNFGASRVFVYKRGLWGLMVLGTVVVLGVF